MHKLQKDFQHFVFVRIEYGEIHLALLVKNAGGVWNKIERAWELPYASVIALGLEKRIKDAHYTYFDQKLLFTGLLPDELAEIEASKPDGVVALWCA